MKLKKKDFKGWLQLQLILIENEATVLSSKDHEMITRQRLSALMVSMFTKQVVR
mgnify:CR=1 FL=1